MSPAEQENDSLSSLEERILRAVQTMSKLRQERDAALLGGYALLRIDPDEGVFMSLGWLTLVE